jgi:putative aldouronate transport system permease protein
MSGKTKTISKQNRTNNLMFHLMLLIPCLLLFIFNMLPIAGIVMAFQNFYPGLGFLKSEWVGLDNFKTLFLHPDTWPAIRNTLVIASGKIIGN